MNLYRVESQLTTLERLIPHLTQHGCDISAQDAARTLMRCFDTAQLAQEHRLLAGAYEQLRGRLKDIAEGRSGYLPIEQVAEFTRCYREHLLRVESRPAWRRAPPLDS
ncbi:MAG TPA: hypothetical protein VM489_15730 [Burkholderiales bacterium]|jgi:hypothetical protein|nr:hypothetical protein [Burkholderiales bacterium]